MEALVIKVTTGIPVDLYSCSHIGELTLGTFDALHVYIVIIISIFLQVMFYALAVITFGTAVPAGQFVPGIMIGSTYGRLVGMFVVKYYRKLNIEEGT